MPSLRRGPADRARTKLGSGYHKLWTAAAISTLGDGVFLTALPLLAAALSRDPLRVSLVAFAGWLPWLLFGLISGALVDRWDRRRVMWAVDAFRFAVAGALGASILAGWASIPLLVALGFLLGSGQTLFDNAAQSLIPALVSRDAARLERANSQLYGAQTVSQNLAGPPLGGALFSLAISVPFLADAVSFAASSLLITTIRGSFTPYRPAGEGSRSSLRADIREGLRWLFGHRLLRALAVMVGLINLSVMAGEAVLVLFAQDKLGLGNVGYGLLLSGFAVGGVLGSLVATRLSRWLGSGTLLVAATLVAAVAWLVLGATGNALLAGATLALTGGAGMVINVVGVSLRQAIVPDHLVGRVVSTFRMVGYGATPIGALLGGVVGRVLGVRAPFLLGAAELERLIGYFVNIIVLRTQVDRRLTFRQLLQRVRAVCLDAFSHQDMPFELLVKDLEVARSLDRSPLVQVVFEMHAEPAEPFTLGGASVTREIYPTGTAKFDLTLTVYDSGSELRGLVEYSTDLFDPGTVERLVADLLTVTAAAVAAPDTPVGELPSGSAGRGQGSSDTVAAAKPAPPPTPAAAAPAALLERGLAAVWSSVLDVDRVLSDDDFFDLGGHSLTAVQIMSRVSEALEREISPALVFSARTVARLTAALLDGELLDPARTDLVQTVASRLFSLAEVA
jgi:MFS family permease/acyl carrier protein